MYAYTYNNEDNDANPEQLAFNLSQDQMNMPIKVYISELIVQLMIGVPTVIQGSLINNLKAIKLPHIKAECINTAAYHLNLLVGLSEEERAAQF